MSNGEHEYDKLTLLLDEQYIWPDYYLFKFIVPTDSLSALRLVLSSIDAKITEKKSKNGAYTSATIKPLINETSEVVNIYKSIKKIKGIMVL